MNNLKNILVTTTNNFEGIKVKQYLKPISAHIVSGTNVFNDFLASFSDFFGGHSQSYQRKILAIYDGVIKSKSILKIGLQELFDLGYDQFQELSKSEIKAALIRGADLNNLDAVIKLSEQ